MQRAPGIPCSLCWEGQRLGKPRAHWAARRRSYVWKWQRKRHILAVITRLVRNCALVRVIQYAAASRLKHWRLWNTGSPGQAGRRQVKFKSVPATSLRGAKRRLVRRSSQSEGGSNHFFSTRRVDCFTEPVIGRTFAIRWLGATIVRPGSNRFRAIRRQKHLRRTGPRRLQILSDEGAGWPGR